MRFLLITTIFSCAVDFKFTSLPFSTCTSLIHSSHLNTWPFAALPDYETRLSIELFGKAIGNLVLEFDFQCFYNVLIKKNLNSHNMKYCEVWFGCNFCVRWILGEVDSGIVVFG